MHSVGIDEYALPLEIIREARYRAVLVWDDMTTKSREQHHFDKIMRDKIKEVILECCWKQYGKVVGDAKRRRPGC
jgi:hypothetical protein